MNVLRRPWLEGGGWVASVALHLGVFVALAAGIGRTPARKYGPTRVSFEVVRPSPGPASLPPAAPIAPPPVPRRAARTEAPADPPPPPRPESPVNAPVDLTGVTLTGSGASWSSVVGNGARMEGAIETPRQAAAPAAPVAEPRIVSRRAVESVLLPAADLSRRPVPPRLDSVLKSHYPADARQRGLSGEAVVRARIDADGRVRMASISSESYAGFGEACRKTVVGSTWLPPEDRVGRPVATEVSYTCRFRVEH
jgi:TonB family protein